MERRVGVNHLAQQSDRNLSVDRDRERTEHFTAGGPGRGGSDQYSGVGVGDRLAMPIHSLRHRRRSYLPASTPEVQAEPTRTLSLPSRRRL